MPSIQQPIPLKKNWNEKTEYGYSGDYSHAWGGSPLLFFSQNILGISPASPAYKAIQINPYTGTKLTWAKGIVPIGNHNRAMVDWKKIKEKTYLYHISIPESYTGIFFRPNDSFVWHVTINGKTIPDSAKQSYLKRGSYVIQYTHD